MKLVRDDVRLYLITGTVDMRMGIDGYIAVVQNRLHMNVFDNSHFKWIRDEENHSASITEEQYGWLMQGLKIDQKRSIEAVSKKYA